MGGKKYDAGIKILEESPIYPASGSLSPESLPLTILDRLFILVGPVQRVFFYDLPSSVPDFVQQRLPQLKLSLSLALREFRPLAGTLDLNSDEGEPEIRSSDVDSVPFTVVESGEDFYYLSGNHARDCRRFDPLLPSLGSRDDKSLVAMQITLFPGVGLALGITISHSVADGATTAHFLKTWAAACRLETSGAPPSYDRSAVPEIALHERLFQRILERVKERRDKKKMEVNDRKDAVCKTFVFSRGEINKMGEEFERKTGIKGSSSFVLTAGFVWACIVEAREGSDGELERFVFVFDIRSRLRTPVSKTYFGNCLGVTGRVVGGSELRGEAGVISAWTAIWKTVRDLEAGDPMQVTEDWMEVSCSNKYSGNVSVAGSPRLGMYRVDFGWGAPRKVEVISIESSGAISMAEGGEDKRGVEVGLALPRDHMERVSAIVAGRLAEIC